MKTINNILYTGLIIFVLVILWFVNVDVSRDDTLPRMIVNVIFTKPLIKVVTTISLIIGLFGIWYNPPK